MHPKVGSIVVPSFPRTYFAIITRTSNHTINPTVYFKVFDMEPTKQPVKEDFTTNPRFFINCKTITPLHLFLLGGPNLYRDNENVL